jgi:hypothetical protein
VILRRFAVVNENGQPVVIESTMASSPLAAWEEFLDGKRQDDIDWWENQGYRVHAFVTLLAEDYRKGMVEVGHLRIIAQEELHEKRKKAYLIVADRMEKLLGEKK